MNVGIYETEKYTAYLYPSKIVICTKIQCFMITHDRYTEALLDDLKLFIIKGKVKRLDDIRDYNGRLKWLNCSKPQ